MSLSYLTLTYSLGSLFASGDNDELTNRGQQEPACLTWLALAICLWDLIAEDS
jgi:hypothetical protein